MLIYVMLFLAAAFPAFAYAATLMVAGEPITLSTLYTYLWVGFWASLGGAVSFYQKVKAKSARWFNFGELIGELATSAFAGIVTGMLCIAAGAHPALTFGLAGITGHMGGRAIFWLEKLAQAYLEKKLGVSTAETPPTEDPK